MSGNGNPPPLNTIPSETLKPQRFAIKFNPPRFILEYSDDVKTRLRTVNVRIVPEADVNIITKQVVKAFPRRIDRTAIKVDQVKRLVQRLIDKCVPVMEEHRERRNSFGRAQAGDLPSPGVDPSTPNGKADSNGAFTEDGEVDLNLVSEDELKKVKEEMDVEFNKHRKVLGDDGFVYDVQKDFNPTEDNDWDSEDESGEDEVYDPDLKSP